MKETPILKTPRLLLRPFEKKDLFDVYEWTSSWEVTRYLWWYPNRDIHVTEKLLGNWIRKKRNYSWAVEKEGEVLGEVQIIKDLPGNGFEFGMISKQKSWGHGYMKEAILHALDFCFTQAGYRFGYAESDERNVRSHALLEKLGFKKAGRKENVPIEKKGESINVLCFELSEEDFRKAYALYKLHFR